MNSGLGARIYFIQVGETGPVKIGLSTNVAKRVKTLQTGASEKLRVLRLIEGGRDVERKIHDDLSQYRLAGEWFAPVPEVVGYAGTFDLTAPPTEIERIFKKFGGPDRIAAILGLTVQRVKRWAYPAERGGINGRVPSKHRLTLLVNARRTGVDLSADEFFGAAQ